MSAIRNQLLCINLNISCWEARRQDKKVNSEVAQAHGTAAGVGRYHKDLLPDAEEHRAILKLRNEWRVWHYENTLPWGNDGSRVIRSVAFLDYAAGHRQYKDKFEALCETFFAAYPTLVAAAEFKLNTLFDAADYPPVEAVKDRFNVRMTTYPMPNAEDFRIIEGIPPEEVERLRTEAVAGINDQVTMAIKDLWGRLHGVVSAMHARLEIGSDGRPLKFHDTLVSNIEDLLDRVPQLNLTGDAEITTMTEEMRALVAFDPATLREDLTVRSEVSDKASELARRMAAWL
ncbi:MAG: hypothetical protein ACYC36_02535 [Bellilinea sp.]